MRILEFWLAPTPDALRRDTEFPLMRGKILIYDATNRYRSTVCLAQRKEIHNIYIKVAMHEKAEHHILSRLCFKKISLGHKTRWQFVLLWWANQLQFQMFSSRKETLLNGITPLHLANAENWPPRDYSRNAHSWCIYRFNQFSRKLLHWCRVVQGRRRQGSPSPTLVQHLRLQSEEALHFSSARSLG